MTGLTASAVSFRVGERTLLDAIDCSIPAGRFTALLGPNGAGKSTLLRVLAGVSRPTSGSVSWEGEDWLRMGSRARARISALVEQDARAELPMTVATVVSLGRTPHRGLFLPARGEDDAVVRRALLTAGMEQFADRQFESLSGGERQRVHLARALAQQPAMLLLDEPTNHLDVAAALGTLALVRTLAHDDGVAVLAALHDLNLAAAYADEIIVIAAGRVVATGPPDRVLTAELISEIYQVDATVLEHPTTGRPLIAYSPGRG